MDLGAVALGIVALVWGADRFVLGAAGVARNLGVSTLVIGLVIVGFGTSAPELLVSAMAGMEGATGLAVGNALGSNIANIGLVLGTTALIVPLAVHSGVLKREFPVLLFMSVAALVLLWDGHLGRLDGFILVSALVGLIYWTVRLALKERNHDPLQAEVAEEIPESLAMGAAVLWLVVGLVVLLVGARLVVWGGVNIAHAFGVSEVIIGLTIVAIGTSLPELAASVMGALKGEPDLAIGNVVGSNLFNLLGVLGLPALIHPEALDPSVLSRDYPVMLGLTLILFLLAYNRRRAPRIGRGGGLLLLGAYGAYMTTLYFATVS